ncbi:MAG: CBS domain-containing protein [Planctomycetes bacterium]|nr:CBS domain-containing protein [Planctomycetota bacterium]
MTVCPYCSAENIEGADLCEECRQPLADLHLAAPATEIEQNLLKDHVQLLLKSDKLPISVHPDKPVGEVLTLLVEKEIGCVLVVNEGKLAGVFSERDALLKLNVEAPELADRPVSDFMTPHPQALQPNVKIAFAVQSMDLGGYRHIPIVDEEGSATSIISVRDILKYLARQIAAAKA